MAAPDGVTRLTDEQSRALAARGLGGPFRRGRLRQDARPTERFLACLEPDRTTAAGPIAANHLHRARRPGNAHADPRGCIERLLRRPRGARRSLAANDPRAGLGADQHHPLVLRSLLRARAVEARLDPQFRQLDTPRAGRCSTS